MNKNIIPIILKYLDTESLDRLKFISNYFNNICNNEINRRYSHVWKSLMEYRESNGHNINLLMSWGVETYHLKL